MPSSADAQLFLVGMMGAGKSTVGRALAERTGRAFVDLDRLVEERAGVTIEALFARGAAQFRILESESLLGITDPRTVIATGGGVVLDAANVDHMRTRGVMIYLRATIDTLCERTMAHDRARPLLMGVDRRERLTTLLAERSAAYEKANAIVDTDGLGIEQTVDAILASSP